MILCGSSESSKLLCSFCIQGKVGEVLTTLYHKTDLAESTTEVPVPNETGSNY